MSNACILLSPEPHTDWEVPQTCVLVLVRLGGQVEVSDLDMVLVSDPIQYLRWFGPRNNELYDFDWSSTHLNVSK